MLVYNMSGPNTDVYGVLFSTVVLIGRLVNQKKISTTLEKVTTTVEVSDNREDATLESVKIARR